MIITPFELYLILLLDSLLGLAASMIAIGLIGLIVLAAWTGNTMDNHEGTFASLFPKVGGALFLSTFLIGIGVSTFVPTTKQMATIIVAPKIINSEASQELQKIPKKLLDLANGWIDEQSPKVVTDNAE